MAEVLGSQGYTTAIRGKWHLAGRTGRGCGLM
jgi:arylsulfatase A-like enzyme